MSSCACGSSNSYETCCGKYISGSAYPETAEQLMRSRYTAYTLCEIDYIVETTVPNQKEGMSRKDMEQWAKSTNWDGIDIVSTEAGKGGDSQGVVEFIAYHRKAETRHKHHELAKFKKIDNRWYYQDSDFPTPKQEVRTAPKVGRNDPCTCGSGKKYKKCCGKA